MLSRFVKPTRTPNATVAELSKPKRSPGDSFLKVFFRKPVTYPEVHAASLFGLSIWKIDNVLSEESAFSGHRIGRHVGSSRSEISGALASCRTLGRSCSRNPAADRRGLSVNGLR